jgi:hypothetical protein
MRAGGPYPPGIRSVLGVPALLAATWFPPPPGICAKGPYPPGISAGGPYPPGMRAGGPYPPGISAGRPCPTGRHLVSRPPGISAGVPLHQVLVLGFLSTRY